MNFIDYIVKMTDRYYKQGFANLTEKESNMLLTLHCLNYRARCMREKFDKDFDYLLEIDTEKDPGYFERVVKTLPDVEE